VNLLETLQKIAATTERLDAALTAIDRERDARQRLEDVFTGRMERLETHIGEIRERLTRLEAAREADRSQMAADLARFKAEVERAELRLSQLRRSEPDPRALPEGEQDT
jgi:primosomal protein N''